MLANSFRFLLKETASTIHFGKSTICLLLFYNFITPFYNIFTDVANVFMYEALRAENAFTSVVSKWRQVAPSCTFNRC